METICGATFVFDHQGVPDLIENEMTGGAYRVMVGRSDSPTGPFVDRSGQSMVEGGGTEILATSGDRIGPGGADVYSEGGDDVLVYHFYDGANNGAPRLAIDRIEWVDGWPQVE